MSVLPADVTKLLVASHNAGKVREIRDLLTPTGLEVISAADLALPEPEETGSSFEDNALLKARACHKASSGLPALSDDSGLVVDALDGAPGIHSARWAGEPRDFAMAMRTIEEKLQAHRATEPQQRTARFVAVLALVTSHGEQTWRGEVDGHMVWPPRGDKGFGYDPVFQPEGYDITFGEMTADEKHGWKPGEQPGLSHRARAFAALWDEVFATFHRPKHFS
jgi:XTP/dITP diphosphohydrolase